MSIKNVTTPTEHVAGQATILSADFHHSKEAVQPTNESGNSRILYSDKCILKSGATNHI